MAHVYIEDIGGHEGEDVTIKGWLHNRRSSGKIHFLQVRDVHADDWDYSPSGQYKFRLRATTMGCPSNCGFATFGDMCACYCPDTMSCPAQPDL